LKYGIGFENNNHHNHNNQGKGEKRREGKIGNGMERIE
jgi:hypothetical protein